MSGTTESGNSEQTAIPKSPPEKTSAFDSDSNVIELALDAARAEWVNEAELAPETLFGRYLIVSRIGKGGMGTVYLARQLDNNQPVAIKVLSRQFSARPDAVRRFLKEAMTLAKIKSPYVIRLIETGEIDNLNFIVSEYIAGGDAGKYVTEHGIPAVHTGLMIFRHVASALEAMHQSGMIHRDVKPENILLETAETASESSSVPKLVSARLSDFGLARMINQSDSMAITRTMAVMGTPRFMSPEQFVGSRDVDARSDIYSLGATMYYLLVGKLLFQGDDIVEMARLHRTASFRPAHLANREISPAINRILSRCLEKLPENRYQTASELLADIDLLTAGQPVETRSPDLVARPNDPSAVICEFQWELSPPPDSIWPHISHTSRINRAIGLPAATFRETERHNGNAVIMAEAKLAGLKLKWREHPFSWIENREMTVLREFNNGPYTWLVNHVELEPLSDGGTRLIHRIEFLPRNVLGRLLARFQIGVMTRRKLESVYKQIADRIHHSTKSNHWVNAIEEPVNRSTNQEAAFVRAADRLMARDVEPLLVRELGAFLQEGFDAEVARIRPRALAIRFDRDERSLIEALILGVPAGMFLLFWDIMCPRCRVASEIVATLEKVQSHSHCKVCQADFEIDLAENVELVFRVHPEIRETDLRTWCVGGPFHAPHVIAQLSLEPGHQRSLDLMLPPGEYQVNGPQFNHPATIVVDSARGSENANIPVVEPPPMTRLQAGSQIITLLNNSQVRVLVRIERSNSAELALTASKAVRIERFRQYLPDQCFSPNQLASISDICVLYTRLGADQNVFDSMDESSAIELSHRFMQNALELVRSHGGDVAYHQADGLTACFQKSESAIAAASELVHSWSRQNPAFPKVRAILHRGPVALSSLDGQTHQTGAVFSQALRLCNSEKASPSDWHGVAMTDSFLASTRSTLENSSPLDAAQTIHVQGSATQSVEKIWLLPNHDSANQA